MTVPERLDISDPAEVSYGHLGTGSEVFWVRSVLGPKSLYTHAFGYNSAVSEPIWLKSGAL